MMPLSARAQARIVSRKTHGVGAQVIAYGVASKDNSLSLGRFVGEQTSPDVGWFELSKET